MMSHACTASMWEAEARLSQVQSQPSLHSEHRPGRDTNETLTNIKARKQANIQIGVLKERLF